MASATAKETFDCTVDQFYKLVTDYEKYPEFLTEVKHVKIFKNGDDSKEMEYEVSVIKKFKYKLKTKEVKNKSVHFEFIGGDVFKKMSGHWLLHDQGGKCSVEYHVEASFGMLIPESMTKPLVSANLPMMMSNFKKRIKQVYGK